MALDDNCIKSLCSMAIAGGAAALGLAGVQALPGVVEFLTHSGDLALSVKAGHERSLDNLQKKVTKSVAKNHKTWLAADHGKNWQKNADVTAALAGLDDALHRARPTIEDMVAANHKSEDFAKTVLNRLPENGLYRSTPIAAHVFVSVIANTHALARTESDLQPLFNTLFQEKVFDQLDAAQADRDEKHGFVMEEFNALREELGQQKGVDPENLRPLFEATGREVPKNEFETAIRHAVNELLAKAETSVEILNDGAAIRSAIEAARSKLKNLDTEGALETLDAAFGEEAQYIEHRQKGAARLALEAAEISLLSFDHTGAISAYERALRMDASNLSTHLALANERIKTGNLYAALLTLNAGRDEAATQSDEQGESVFLSHIGDVQMAQGNLEAALGSFQADMEIAEGLTKRDPQNTEWQRDLSVSHNKIGDVQVAKGNLEAALESFQASMEIREDLAKRDPQNTEWQRDLSVSHNKIGNVQRAQGNLDAALESYQAGMGIAKGLAKRDPANTEWQRDLSVSHNKIGNVQVAQGNLDAALESYQAGMGIAKGLTKRDPANTEWQRDLSISHNKIGNVQVAQGNLDAALESYQADLEIAEGLAERDPTNTGWQRDLIVSHDKLASLGHKPEFHYGEALALSKRLQKDGRLAPTDSHFVEQYENALAAAKSQ